MVREDNYNALFWVSAAFSALAFIPLTLKRVAAPARGEASAAGADLGFAVILAASSLTLFSMAVGMGAVALPVAITADFAGSKLDVGLAFSVCALLEVPGHDGDRGATLALSGFQGHGRRLRRACALFCSRRRCANRPRLSFGFKFCGRSALAS